MTTPKLWPATLHSGEVAVRPLAMRDGMAWATARRRSAAWLAPWDATVPPGGDARPATFAALVRRQRRAARRGTTLPFAVDVDGRFAGQVTVSNIVRGSAMFASVGYWIDVSFAGRGVMPRAVALVIDHCFAAGLHRIEVSIRPENANSLRIVEKLEIGQVGYSPRYLHIDGEWRDHMNFAITREEWPPGGLIGRVESHQSH
ncbi:GNAT family N-acetyltransferase [Nocardioides sp. Kera G14]|uniref:GNAT family N-acetyltransferase n=1 Tax=Nocardioides sp. Kera G14 TaxID=2884264 RepID=UPI001D10E2FE|nr:GNAT family protein [Nocardioides sp. Kera G14]UDY24106.1 GNAT family N-acetyltransferase [Nocardioides sp. Kera G14]